MHCPSCKQSIDDDSLHCDQCGVELMQCPRCGHLGKGKRCPADGTALVSRKAMEESSGVTTATASSSPGPSTSTPTPAAPIHAANAIAPRRLRLCAASQGIDMTPASGAVLGRRLGPHADVLSRFAQISSQHVELRQDAAGGWFVKDLNSYNHSFIDGRQIAPGVEHPLPAGCVLSLGDVALDVVLE